jgi:hypothetical protein
LGEVLCHRGPSDDEDRSGAQSRRTLGGIPGNQTIDLFSTGFAVVIGVGDEK